MCHGCCDEIEVDRYNPPENAGPVERGSRWRICSGSHIGPQTNVRRDVWICLWDVCSEGDTFAYSFVNSEDS